MAQPDAKRLRDLLVDFYLQHDPEKLKRGLDINGIVLWTGRNGIDALNEVLKNQTGKVLDLNKNLGNAQQKAQRMSTVFNPNKKKAKTNANYERELQSRINYFYQRHDRSKLTNIHKILKFTLYHGEEKLNERLMSKYNAVLPKELPSINQMRENPDQIGGVKVKRIESATPETAIRMATESALRDSVRPHSVAVPAERKRKRKGKMEDSPNIGSPPPLPAKNKPKKTAPPLPSKSPKSMKPLPEVPSERAVSEIDIGVIKDPDFDEQKAFLELEGYLNFHDKEILEGGLDYFVDLYAEQGREIINQRLEQIYGDSLDTFKQNQDQFLKMKEQQRVAQVMKEEAEAAEEDEYGFEEDEVPMLPPNKPKQKKIPPLPAKNKTPMSPPIPKNKPPVLPSKNKSPPLPSKKKKKNKDLPPLPPKDPIGEASLNSIPSQNTNAQMQEKKSRLLQAKVGGKKMMQSMSFGMRSLVTSMKIAVNPNTPPRFSLSPNANLKDVSSPIEATPEAGACGNYRLDMLGSSIGICVCGFSRAEHTHQAKFGAPQKNKWAHTSAKFNPSNNARSDQMQLFKRFNQSKKAAPKPKMNAAANASLNEMNLPTVDYTEVIGEDKKQVRVDTPYDEVRKASKNEAPGVDKSRVMFMKRSTVSAVNAKPSGEPCDNFRLDLAGKFHGDCVCGFAKMAHKKKTEFTSDVVKGKYEENLQNARSRLGRNSSANDLGSKIKPTELKWNKPKVQPKAFTPKPSIKAKPKPKPKPVNASGAAKSGEIKIPDMPPATERASRVEELKAKFSSSSSTRTSDPGGFKICPSCKSRTNKKFCGDCGTKVM